MGKINNAFDLRIEENLNGLEKSEENSKPHTIAKYLDLHAREL